MRRDRAALSLFLFFQSLYALTASGHVTRVPDEFEVYFQAEHFVDAADLSVPQTLELVRPIVVDGKVVGNRPLFFGVFGRDGKPYAPYGPLTALLMVPHHLAARLVARAAGVPRTPLSQGLAWFALVAALTSLATSTAAALAVARFYRAAIALGASRTRSLVLSALLGGATVLWVYGTTLYSEAFVAAALIWAAALLLEARADRSAGRERVALAAFLLAVAALTKLTAFVFTPPFVLAALAAAVPARTRWRVAAALAAGVGVAAAVHLGWNLQRFGDLFEFGYDWSETIPALPPRPFAIEELPRGLAVLLLSPGKSLLLWAPPLVLAAMRARSLWQADRALAIGLAGAAVIALVFYGSYMFPEGGYAHGPRHLVPLVPLLLLAAAHPATRAPSRAAVVACALVGGVVALGAVSVSYLQDQTMGSDLSGNVRAGYYERIEAPPGRPWNRYGFGYVPFARALASPSWWSDDRPGSGPDYLPLFLSRVRRTYPGGGAIPPALPHALAAIFALLLIWAAVRLRFTITAP